MGRTRTAALLLAASLAVVACGDDDAASDVTVPDGETTTTSSTSTSTTSTTEDPTAAVEQAFYDQWDAFVEILSDPDIDSPLIDEYFTGRAKESLIDVVSEYIAEGKAAIRPENPADFEPRILETLLESSSTALVFECTVDGARVINADSGEVLDDSVGTYEARNTFVLTDGRWKLENSVQDLGEGDPSCDDL